MNANAVGLVVVTLALVGGRCGVAAGEPVLLSDVPDYPWWYGCTPTATGMLLGYYDRHGYDGLRYDELVPGVVAELSTFTNVDSPMQAFMASPGHIEDFYSDDTIFGGFLGVGVEDDDRPPPWHEFDCLADFIGTSQDAHDNYNGNTNHYAWTTNAPATEADNLTYGVEDGIVYGLGAYVRYASYEVELLYSQPIFGFDEVPAGFTFEEYMAEIDAGRPVIVHTADHSMLGYGYDADEQLVYVHDTYSPGGGSMPWGGLYGNQDYSGTHEEVTVLEITGGQPVPEPSTWVLLLSGIVGSFLWRRRPRRSG